MASIKCSGVGGFIGECELSIDIDTPGPLALRSGVAPTIKLLAQWKSQNGQPMSYELQLTTVESLQTIRRIVDCLAIQETKEYKEMLDRRRNEPEPYP